MTRAVTATYRLQLRSDFGFSHAIGILPYLVDLGVSHVYLSPIFQSTPGSAHGYDVVDFSRVDDELGGEPGFARLVDEAHRLDLGIVLDVVPHHMAIGVRENAWWWDVLTHGSEARFANHFDIDWHAPEERMRHRVVLPVLGDHYGRVLERGDLQLEPDPKEVALVALAGGMTLPLSPETVGQLLERVAEITSDSEIGFLARALCRLGVSSELAIGERMRDISVIQELFAVRRTEPAVAQALEATLDRLNHDPDALDALLDQQHYRLVRWQVAAQELDYRRFFDVNSLVALRSERPEVFADTHRRIQQLVTGGALDGLRVDHVDGLKEPNSYLHRLRAAAPNAWIVVEKILTAEEHLPDHWPIDGTTGYDFGALVGPWLVDPRGEAALTALYQDFTGDLLGWHDHAVAAKREMLRTILGSDVERLTALLVRICEGSRQYRDFTRAELRDALIEVVAHCDGYRSYVGRGPGGSPEIDEADRAFVHRAVVEARQEGATLDPDLFTLMETLLTLDTDGAVSDLEAELALRFQQLTGPATAKGEEDTASYRSVRLLTLNDVGMAPDRFSVTTEELLEWCAYTSGHWPRTMLNTSTHDSKRSEDVRARLAVLSEVPERWGGAIAQWHDASAEYRSSEVDPLTEWFVYQTVFGVHPRPASEIWPAIEKSLRESKLRTSWVQPETGFESAVQAFLQSLLADPAFTSSLDQLLGDVLAATRANALAQLTLRLTVPGVPDTYQGTELWTSALVDPDNRQPVDYDRRRLLLAEFGDLTPADRWHDDPDEGSAKLLLLRSLLRLRLTGLPLEPLPMRGTQPSAALAFRRGDVAVVVPRFWLNADQAHAETVVTLPPGKWFDRCSQQLFEGGEVSVAELTARFPVWVGELSQ